METVILKNHPEVLRAIRAAGAMKTYTPETLPAHAVYLGSQHGDGSIDESLADAIDLALAPCRVREPDGTFAFFDEALELTK